MKRSLATLLLVSASCGQGRGGETTGESTEPRVEVREEPAPARPPGPPPAGTAPDGAQPGRDPPPVPPRSDRFPGLTQTPEEILSLLVRSRPQKFKPVGSTSVVFKMDLDAPIDAAYRPRTKMQGGGRGWLNEIAAYRVARLLGLDSVPPAISRRLPKPAMRDLFDPEFRESWSDYDWVMPHDREGVRGAAILWVSEMRELGFESGAGRQRWERALAQSGPPPSPAEAPLMRDLSSMIAFDYVIANFDRWSGGNVQSDRTGRRVIIRDHNLAFVQPLPPRLARRMMDDLIKVERFSRTFVQRLRALDEGTLRAELARDPGAAADPPLDRDQIRALLDRVQTVLSHVGALVEQHGAERVLVFP